MEWREVEFGEIQSPWSTSLRGDGLIPFGDLIYQFESLFSSLSSSLSQENDDLLCNDNLHQAVKSAKILCGRYPQDYLEARGRLNPYECLGKGPKENPFLNRSALKLANLDYLFDLFPSLHSSSSPSSPTTTSSSKEIFTWADICGGPGGFSEYLLTTPTADDLTLIGFGMSLTFPSDSSSSSCNWNLTHYHDPPEIAIITSPSSPPTPNPTPPLPPLPPPRRLFAIIHGADSTGNILHPPNIDSFCESIDALLPPRENGVQFFCGDGGMEEGRDKEDQESIHLPLIISQIIAMVGSLQSRGKFLIKTFTHHQSGTFLVIFLLSHLFEELSIVKPITSRPTSSERYVFCRGLRDMSRMERRDLQDLLWRHQQSASVTSPSSPSASFPNTLQKLISFRHYLREENDSLLLIQLHSFLKIFHHLTLEKDCVWSSVEDQTTIKRMEAAVNSYAVEDRSVVKGNKRQRTACHSENQDPEIDLDLHLLSTRQLELIERMSDLLSARHPSLSPLKKKRNIRAVDYFRQWGFL